MSELEQVLERVEQPKETRTVLDLIESIRPEVERSLQSEQGAAILTRHYYSAIRYNPLLMQCTPDSLVAALLLSAQVRLEPGPLGHVYLIPFKNGKTGRHEVVWMLGYTGIVEIGRRGGAVGLASTVVYDGDEYERPWQNEKGWHWRLVPAAPESQGERVGVLVSWREGSERMALHCPPERIDTAIAASRNPQAKALREEDWYWRKTGVRFARPWLPLTTDTSGAFARAAVADGAVVSALDYSDGEAVPVLTEGDES